MGVQLDGDKGQTNYSLVHRLDGDADARVLGQRERLERAQQPVFVDGFDGGGHAGNVCFLK